MENASNRCDRCGRRLVAGAMTKVDLKGPDGWTGLALCRDCARALAAWLNERPRIERYGKEADADGR